ncbi:MAG: Rne/Rng family ribonuclease, partial [Deltaproteobacteria bacterium]|nr:Rne/Rng family ribonuclease [Deltaproteobacteria bacterium]
KRSICYEIFRDIEREILPVIGGEDIYIHVHPEIEHVLREEEQQPIMDLEKRINRRIIIVPNENFHLEQYEIKA